MKRFLKLSAILAATLAAAGSLVQAVPPPTGLTAASARVAAADYAEGSLMSGLFRWRRFPVKVYFDRGNAYSAERQKRAVAGFDHWAKATNGVLSYAVVNSAKEADVTVRFLPVRYLARGSRTVGQTLTLIRGGSYLAQARIDLAVQGTDSRHLTEVAAHEWGHALGINGHSQDPKDLMYPSAIRYVTPFPFLRPAAKKPTERDLNTIRRAYPNLFTKKRA